MPQISADARIYCRPFSFADSPQAVDGDGLWLAGGLSYVGLIEIMVRDGGRTAAHWRVPPSGVAAVLADLPDGLAETASRQIANLAAKHPPIACGDRMIRLDQPQIMGILNVTPDSFSDGGQFMDTPGLAVEHGVQMQEQGASIIDIGGESTRPDAPAVWEGDEIKRVVPVVEALVRGGAAISVDTRKASVMQAALDAGAHIVNDVSALLHDPKSLDVMAASACPVVLMHAPSAGMNPHAGGTYAHPVFDVFDWLEARIEAVIAGGVARERLIIDPGFGFGKSLADNLALMNRVGLFHALGLPLLVGVSRKRMIGALSNEAPATKRLGGSVALAVKAFDAGAQILRVHDVHDSVQAARIWRGLRDAALGVLDY